MLTSTSSLHYINWSVLKSYMKNTSVILSWQWNVKCSKSQLESLWLKVHPLICLCLEHTLPKKKKLRKEQKAGRWKRKPLLFCFSCFPRVSTSIDENHRLHWTPYGLVLHSTKSKQAHFWKVCLGPLISIFIHVKTLKTNKWIPLKENYK